MKTKRLEKTLAVVMSGFLVTYNLIGIPSPLFAAPPEGKGSERAQEVANPGNGGGQGNQESRVSETPPERSAEASPVRGLDRAEQVRSVEEPSPSREVGASQESPRSEGVSRGEDSSAVRGLDRAELVREIEAQAHSKGEEKKDSHAKKAGEFGEGELPSQANENALIHRIEAGIGREASFLREKNRAVVEDFEKAIGELRKKEHARWWHNPKDDRGQGNMSKLDMLDPYGHSKDDRMELYGNRGRPIREEEISTFLYTNYLLVDWISYYAAVGNWIYGVGLEMLGLTPEEITFLQNALRGVYGPELANAFYQGLIAMEPVEMSFLSISDLDLSRLIDYAAAMNGDGTFTSRVTDSSVEYSLSLTNPYSEPLTLTVSTTIQYTPGINRNYVYTTNPYYFENYTLTSYALDGESTQTWQDVTIQPGETLTLSDTYTASGTNYGICGFNNNRACHYGGVYDGQLINIGYTFGVTLTDSNTGATYYEPASGWFNASSTTYGYGY